MGDALELLKTSEDLGRDLEAQGRVVAKTNPRLSRLALMLTHPEFAQFFDENFQTWADGQDAIVMLKMGAYMRDKLQHATGETVSGNQLAAAMKRVLDDRETRAFVFSRLSQFIKGGSLEPSQRQIT